MPRKTTPLKAAKQIAAVLEKMLEKSYNRSDFMNQYVVEASKQNSPKYKTEIAKMLKDNNCFSANGKAITLIQIPFIDTIKASIEKALLVRKSGICKSPKLKYSIGNALKNSEEIVFKEKKLIPKSTFLDSIETIELVEYLQINRKIMIANNQIYIPV